VNALSYLGGLSQTEIAKKLGAPLGHGQGRHAVEPLQDAPVAATCPSVLIASRIGGVRGLSDNSG
jgi:hypothetical protein